MSLNEQNFYIKVKYGLTEQIPELQWDATITATGFMDEERTIESFRTFYRHVKDEMKTITFNRKEHDGINK